MGLNKGRCHCILNVRTQQEQCSMAGGLLVYVPSNLYYICLCCHIHLSLDIVLGEIIFYYTFKNKVQSTGFRDLKVKHAKASISIFESLELIVMRQWYLETSHYCIHNPANRGGTFNSS